MAQMDVIIVGAGLAGLTCAITLARYGGIRVTVLERTPVFGFAGNGIQVPCNAGHVLRHLGLLDKLLDKAGGPAAASLSVDYADGRVLLTKDYARCEEVYGAPWILSHRADYIDVLLEETRRLGVAIKLDSEVEYVDFETPWLRLVNGQVYHADVIIGCDGVHSKIRTQLHPSIQPQHGGSFAYRVLFTPSQLSSPTLQHILTTRSCRLWLGPQVHAVFYPVRNGATFNLVFIVADAELNARCQGGDSLAPMREWMADWDPALREMLAVATELARFPLLELEELPSWGRGCVAVMGDAAHPMLPYLGQGAAIAVEDAAILGTLLGRLTQHASWQGRFRNHHIPAILTAYAAIQRPRAALVVAQSREQGSFNHLAPGTAAQRERDAEYAAFDWGACVSRSGWVDAAFNRELLGRRAVDVAEDMFGVMLRDAAFGDLLEKIPCVSEQAIYEPAEDTVCKL